jgi:hypothetical protein
MGRICRLLAALRFKGGQQVMGAAKFVLAPRHQGNNLQFQLSVLIRQFWFLTIVEPATQVYLFGEMVRAAQTNSLA